MYRSKRGLTVASTLLLLAVLVSACEQPYSTPPAVTNTPIDTNSFFSTPIPEQPGSMTDVETFTTQTALAAQTDPNAVIPTATPGVTDATAAPAGDGATPTSTPLVELVPTATATLAVSNAQPTTSSSSSSAPGTYTLKAGEFPYCIARRFNVDPDQLLALNGLSSGDAGYLAPGTVLKIPQSGSFPGDRMLANHPTTYTVVSSDETVYGVACKFGDITPASIAEKNGISVDASLSAGQTLSIP